MKNTRPKWIYMPLPRSHEHLTSFRAFIATVKMPEIDPPRNCDIPHLRFFTDGAARFPKHLPGRIATWSVVQDFSVNEGQVKQAADFLFVDLLQYPFFHVSAVGIVPGEQTVARAELFAILVAAKKAKMCEPIPWLEFVSHAPGAFGIPCGVQQTQINCLRKRSRMTRNTH